MDIALFGGTFDPVHKAHLTVARAARDRFGFQKVLIIPAAVPPHKLHRQTESWEHRYRMVELACLGEDRLEPSDLEAGTTRSYTIDTLSRVRARVGPDPRLWFIIGADAFAEIGTWHRWQDVIQEVDFVVVSRPGHEYTVPEGARVHVLDSIFLEVSSSTIRDMLARCEKPEELPLPVFEYIRENRLYRFGSACPPVREGNHVPSHQFSQAEYLLLERNADKKHEFLEGQIYDLAGGTPLHSQIVMNVSIAIGRRVSGGCRMYNSDLRVSLAPGRAISYPDITIACDAPTFLAEDANTLANPFFLVEVLSPSTETYDRGKKAAMFRRIPSMKGYLLVDQTPVRVEYWEKQPDGSWTGRQFEDAGGIIDLTPLGIELPVCEIYAGVE